MLMRLSSDGTLGRPGEAACVRLLSSLVPSEHRARSSNRRPLQKPPDHVHSSILYWRLEI